MKGKSGYVYLLRCGSYFKIGKSRNVEKRLLSISTSCAVEPQLIASGFFLNYNDKETELHLRYKNFRLRGEWFRLPTWVVSLIKDELEAGVNPKVKILNKYKVKSLEITKQKHCLKCKTRFLGVGHTKYCSACVLPDKKFYNGRSYWKHAVTKSHYRGPHKNSRISKLAFESIVRPT